MATTAPTSVLRLTFSSSGSEIRLIRHQRTQMTLPPSDPVAEYRGRAGHWFEVDDAAGAPLYGRRMADPMPTHHEVLAPEGGATWLPRSAAASEFQLLAPLLPGAVSVAIFSSSGGGDTTAAAREIVRVNLQNLAP